MTLYKKIYCNNEKELRRKAIIGESPKIEGPIIINNISKDQLIIGNKVIMRYNRFFCFGKGKLSIGNFCYFGDHTQIDAAEEVKIGDYCMFSNNIMIQDHTSHPISPRKRRDQLINLQKIPTDVYDTIIEKVTIKNNVWIGKDAIVLKGVTIGEGSIVATRAVVTKDVPPFSIVAGNPSKVVKAIKDD